MLRHLFVPEPKSELMSRKGNMLPLISILDALISFIYALLQFLLTSPSLKVLFVEGIIFPLTEVRLIAVPPELYACPLIVLTLKSFTNMLRHRFVPEPKSELLVSKGTIFPLEVIFPLIHVSPETCKL